MLHAFRKRPLFVVVYTLHSEWSEVRDGDASLWTTSSKNLHLYRTLPARPICEIEMKGSVTLRPHTISIYYIPLEKAMTSVLMENVRTCVVVVRLVTILVATVL